MTFAESVRHCSILDSERATTTPSFTVTPAAPTRSATAVDAASTSSSSTECRPLKRVGSSGWARARATASARAAVEAS
eukprot:7388119-Prymnesium_polylepis.1